MPKRLYLVRHGETDANFSKIIEGRGTGASPGYGNPLNHNGVSQANALGCALTGINIHHIYMSPARRAIETADKIRIWTEINNIPFKKLVTEDLAEINFGVIEGLSGKNAREKYPDLFKTYHEKPSQAVFPEGESIIQAYKRVGRAVDEILAAHTLNENILVVSHGGVMTFIFVHIFKLNIDMMFRAIRHYNSGLSIIEWEKPNKPLIVCMNDISHLKNEHAERLKEPLYLPY